MRFHRPRRAEGDLEMTTRRRRRHTPDRGKGADRDESRIRETERQGERQGVRSFEKDPGYDALDRGFQQRTNITQFADGTTDDTASQQDARESRELARALRQLPFWVMQEGRTASKGRIAFMLLHKNHVNGLAPGERFGSCQVVFQQFCPEFKSC